ncbi:MAG: helix-turn-helix transcriptional regulator [Patescibacteria group bacterium]
MEKNKELGQLLKELREKAFYGMGLRRVADKVGIDYAHIFRIEVGQYIPSDENLIKLLDAYKANHQEKMTAFKLARLTPGFHKVIEQARKYLGSDKALAGAFFRKEKGNKRSEKDEK